MQYSTGVQLDIDYPGNDIMGIYNISDARGCQKVCEVQSQCQFWTYIDDPSGGTIYQSCLLKNIQGSPSSNPLAVHGPKICQSEEAY